MLIGKKEFVAGLLFAAITVSTVSEVASLQAAGQKNMSPEIRFSQQIGLFDSTQLSGKVLSRNISRQAFQRGLNGVMVETGLLNKFDLGELSKLGITNGEATSGPVTRKEACETILRAIMHGWNQDLLPRPSVEASLGFRDWKAEEKYRESLTFAITSGIFQGSTDGFFRPDDHLKVREALLVLKRFFDLAATNRIPTRIALFEDVNQDHYMTGPLLNLRKAGAFDLTNLGRKLNGTGPISVKDLSMMIQGILGRLDRAAHVSQIKQLEHGHGKKIHASRNLLACMSAVLTDAMPHSESNQHILYSDVKEGGAVDHSLKTLSKAGIRMGYNNNRFKGSEKVTRFEALGLINRIITELEPEQIRISDGKAATRDDIESLKNLLIERRARIRKILNRE